MKITVLLYPGITALDAIGPYEVLRMLPAAELEFVAREAGPVKTDSGVLSLHAARTLHEVSTTDLLLVPGGPGETGAREYPDEVAWLKRIHPSTQWTASVCTGSLLLGHAGILNGLEATTHWACFRALEELGAKPVGQRWVRSGKIVTAAGVSAGIDMALWLVAQIAGEKTAEAVQLTLEYDPQPPFDSGSKEKASKEVVAKVAARLATL